MHSFLLPNNLNNDTLLQNIFFNIDWNLLEITMNNSSNSINTESNTNLIDKVYINHSLHKCLNNAKQQINENESKWDNIKKYTNSYEFIHTSIPGLKHSISKLKPLSRSFYKMIEIYNFFNLSNHLPENLFCFNLAEGPGGFIEALTHLRTNTKDKYVGMTLIETNDMTNIPGWDKAKFFLNNNPNVFLEFGPSKNGNLFNPMNFLYISSTYNQSSHLVTGDGGFDFSVNYNQQEVMSIKLIFSQIMYAISIQKPNGCFILKMFDLFHKINIDLLYLLNYFYDQVYITKPNTSREANAEKYIVCIGFKLEGKIEFFNKLKEYFYVFLVNSENINNININGLFNYNHNVYYLNKIIEINTILGQLQINNIINTINLLNFKNKNDKIEIYKKNNIAKSIQWCEEYNIPYNNSINTNLFKKS
jgi:23S rRNA U2552 (ribose-2'-O)-methylase RlmE/FtsJ